MRFPHKTPPPPPTPAWTRLLTDEDWAFILRFILTSGSLKNLAKQYGVSYPTIRIRLDRLIEKVKSAQAHEPEDPFISRLRSMAIDGQLAIPAAKTLIKEYRKLKP